MLLCLLWFFFPITVAENSQSLLTVLVQQKMAITSQLLCCVRMLPVPPKQWLHCGKTWAVPANSFTVAKHAKLQGKGFTVALLRPATTKSLNGASWEHRLHISNNMENSSYCTPYTTISLQHINIKISWKYSLATFWQLCNDPSHYKLMKWPQRNFRQTPVTKSTLK